MKKTLAVLLILALLTAGWFFVTRNNLVRLDEGVKAAWSQVENVYQRRLDLIPNLVATVQGYASHERETLEAVIKARAQASQISAGALEGAINDPQSFAKFQAAQASLSSALSRLMVVVERYPELKADQNFLQLQSQLEGTENRITVERQRFNEAAQTYNTQIRTFPSSMVASVSGFEARPYFQAQSGAEQAPKVEFRSPETQGTR